MEPPVLLFDGVCGFCNWSVRFVLRHDRKRLMRFAPLQGAFAARIRAQHPELEKIDSLVLVESDPQNRTQRASVRSTAALRLAGYLGGAWGLLRAFAIIPRPARDFLYDCFARYRYKLFGRLDTCMVPSAEVRDRFLL